MTQANLTLANTSRTAYRAAHNQANETLVSNNAGPSEPPVTYGGMFWFDETDSAIKLRNQANTNWIVFAKVDQATGDLSLALPSGLLAHFGMAATPFGWIRCNGAAASRTVYANLFAAIGTTYGVGDGSTTFNLPDARGVMLRGLDEGRGLDPGRVIGSYQSDAIRNIVGVSHWMQRGGTATPTGALFSAGTSSIAFGGSSSSEFQTKVGIDASRIVPTASENRVKSLATPICIKY